MNGKKYDIVAIGECLLDVFAEKSQDGKSMLMKGNPGGAPVNVLAQAAKLGLKTAYITKISDDIFGAFLKSELEKAGIDTNGVLVTKDCLTTLAIVSLDDKGNRSFRFYREKTADVMLNKDEINYDLIKNAEVFHFGSVSMTAEPARSATLAAVLKAKESGLVISFDPNLRIPLWNDLDEAREIIMNSLEMADLVKVSDDELIFLTGHGNLEKGMKEIYERFSLKLLSVTLGPKGCICYVNGRIVREPTFDVKTVDTTGAGDSFWGAMLYQLISNKKDILSYNDKEISEMIRFSNAAGSLTTTIKGAINAMPDKQSIVECIKNVRYLNP
ncbi:MAG: carbohydrate kinase [Clostridiaceae bacterium]|nr:carbohydrate kinase [Clostridiaceae bacterium]